MRAARPDFTMIIRPRATVKDPGYGLTRPPRSPTQIPYDHESQIPSVRRHRPPSPHRRPRRLRQRREALPERPGTRRPGAAGGSVPALHRRLGQGAGPGGRPRAAGRYRGPPDRRLAGRGPRRRGRRPLRGRRRGHPSHRRPQGSRGPGGRRARRARGLRRLPPEDDRRRRRLALPPSRGAGERGELAGGGRAIRPAARLSPVPGRDAPGG
ncbi:MAG: hypothetical protein MZU91_10975 [Desulfosudis oleivorans]|nr:hypothetical protein [Desulfosudis oleivorans]